MKNFQIKGAFKWAVCDLHHRALPNNLAWVKRPTCLKDHQEMMSPISKGKRHEYDEPGIKEPLLGMATSMVEELHVCFVCKIESR